MWIYVLNKGEVESENVRKPYRSSHFKIEAKLFDRFHSKGFPEENRDDVCTFRQFSSRLPIGITSNILPRSPHMSIGRWRTIESHRISSAFDSTFCFRFRFFFSHIEIFFFTTNSIPYARLIFERVKWRSGKETATTFKVIASMINFYFM